MQKTKIIWIHLEPALVSGLASAGMHIFTLATSYQWIKENNKEMKANMGIMITASHNPYYDNGLKLFNDGLKLSDKIEKN